MERELNTILCMLVPESEGRIASGTLSMGSLSVIAFIMSLTVFSFTQISFIKARMYFVP